MIRILILLGMLAGLGWFLDREQQAGRFQQADDLYLDFLVANARDRFTAVADKGSDEVVFVRMREEDRIDYSGWPPQPIDWRMILKNLAAFEPEVLVIATPLAWPEPKPDFISAVAESLIPFPSAVLGVLAEAGAGDNSPGGGAAAPLPGDAFPKISRLHGKVKNLATVHAVIAAPEEAVRSQMELGFVSMPAMAKRNGGKALVPLAVRYGEIAAPSLILQALTRYSRAPYAGQRLRLGTGAGAHLGKGIYIPLTASGEANVATTIPVPSVNALDLMTVDLAEALSADDSNKLGRNKIIVIGIDNDKLEPTLDRLQVQALAQILALPRIHTPGISERWVVGAAAALAGLSLLRVRRSHALRMGLLLIFAGLVISFVLFQSRLIWFPPTAPAALIAASALFARFFGRSASPLPQPA